MQDVMSLIAGVYYTPLVSSVEEREGWVEKFYLIFTYPSHKVKLRMPLPDYEYGKSMIKYYKTDKINTFIESLWDNEPYELHLTNNFDLKLTITETHIDIIHVDDEIEFIINNTELFRNQLADELLKFAEFVSYYHDD